MYSVKAQNTYHDTAIKALHDRLPSLTRPQKGFTMVDFAANKFTITVRVESYPFRANGNFFVEWQTPQGKPGAPFQAVEQGINCIAHLMDDRHLFLFNPKELIDAVESVREDDRLIIPSLTREIQQFSGKAGKGFAVSQQWVLNAVPFIAVDLLDSGDLKAIEQFFSTGKTDGFDYVASGKVRTKHMDKQLRKAGVLLPTTPICDVKPGITTDESN